MVEVVDGIAAERVAEPLADPLDVTRRYQAVKTPLSVTGDVPCDVQQLLVRCNTSTAAAAAAAPGSIRALGS